MTFVVRVLVDNDECTNEDASWHYSDSECGDPVVLCTREQLVDVEHEKKWGRITCSTCREYIKAMRKIDLR